MQAAFVWSKSTAQRRVGSFCRPCTTQPNLRAVPGMSRFIASGNHAKDKSKESTNPSPPSSTPSHPDALEWVRFYRLGTPVQGQIRKTGESVTALRHAQPP